jgi:hypothetical protein
MEGGTGPRRVTQCRAHDGCAETRPCLQAFDPDQSRPNKLGVVMMRGVLDDFLDRLTQHWPKPTQFFDRIEIESRSAETGGRLFHLELWRKLPDAIDR